MFHASTSLVGGSHAVTVAQCPFSPDVETSYTSPPTSGSKTTSWIVSRIECVAAGHQLVASAVKTRNASSTAQSTVTTFRTTSMTSDSLMPFLLCSRPPP